VPEPSNRPDGPRRRITFRFEETVVEALEGDSIAAALFAAGRRTFSRSFKYHRPRGLLCCAGRCPNCLMNVDGEPNVRTCTTPVRENAVVRAQNAWPSLDSDALSGIGLLDRFLPVGFYYKTFIHPRSAWPVYEHFLRHVGGVGVIDPSGKPEGYHHEYRSTGVAVVGGGAAGLCAALAAARLGARVTLIETQDQVGGELRGDRRPAIVASGESGDELARRLAQEARAAGVEIRTGAHAFGAYEGRRLAVEQGHTLLELAYERLVLATGAFERPAVFPGNDLPGVMLGSGALRLLRLYGVLPGKVAVIATANASGHALALELAEAGVELALVADARTAGSDPIVAELDAELGRRGIQVEWGACVAAAHGRQGLGSVQMTRGQATSRVDCDLLCLSLGWEPALALLAQERPEPLRWDASRGVFCVGPEDEEAFAVGSVAGAGALDECLRLGAAAGAAAASQPLPNVAAAEAASDEGLVVIPGPPASGRRFVCLCEDVTDKDVRQAIEEGFDEVELLKRYSTASMGPCQGKMCRAAVSQLCAECTGVTPSAAGRSRLRPPAYPVTLGALGAGHAGPVRRTPMHDRHVALGARMMNLGEWKRPEVYTSVEEECRAVRNAVGLIDVGTLGKLEIVGADAARILEKVYTNRVADLPVGRVRYGLVCDETGAVFDDGTIARLGEQRWFVSTTTSGVESMDALFRSFAVPGLGRAAPHFYITQRTAGLAAVNLAGPRSRELLSRLTELDLSREAFPYLHVRVGTVAGVAALLLRIGFVGELGYEIHYPAEYGAYLWDRLLEAGREFGIRPFGVEAQRVLRLEKQHLIVSHDTDALSSPWDAGMAWVVKLEKEDFVGRAILARRRAEAGGAAEPVGQRLVGFTVSDPSIWIPEGCQVEEGGRPAGRVTSFRRSPTLNRGIGLAWVPAGSAREGASIRIAAPAGSIPATVALRPFYDPEGARVRA
jgi:sarcosine oxidase subunit alpha